MKFDHIEADSKSEAKANIVTINENECGDDQQQPLPQQQSTTEPQSSVHKSSFREKLDTSGAPCGPTTAATSQTTTPSRSNLAFKFNKSKKESSNTSSNSNSDPASQHASVTSTPRKKIEKLNYKAGTDILEAYKIKYKHSVCLINSELTDADMKTLEKAQQQSNGEQASIVDVKKSESNVFEENEKSSGGGGVLRSFKDSIKSKMRRVVEEKRALLDADNNEQIVLENVPADEPKPSSTSDNNNNDNQPETEVAENNDENAKNGKKSSKLKKIVFV